MLTPQDASQGPEAGTPGSDPAPDAFPRSRKRRRMIAAALVVVCALAALTVWRSWRAGRAAPAPAAKAVERFDAGASPLPGKPSANSAAGAPAATIAPGPILPPEERASGGTDAGPVAAAPLSPPAAATPSPDAPPHAAPAPEKPPAVKGEAFTRALIRTMDAQVNRTFWGWRPDSILFGKLALTDDVNNRQLGVLEVARRTAIVLNENMSRFALTEAQNPHVNNAMNFFMVSSEQFWFPSASGKYKEALENLDRYLDDLRLNRSRFYTRVDNLIALMNHFRDVLGSAFYNLIKDAEADGSPVSWFACDDYFYLAQGVALGMADILEGVKLDFADQLAKKNSSKLVDDAIHALHAAAHLRPWIITDAAKDGFLANHRANMATYIGEAEHISFTLVSVLATN